MLLSQTYRKKTRKHVLKERSVLHYMYFVLDRSTLTNAIFSENVFPPPKSFFDEKKMVIERNFHQQSVSEE